jgi:NAD(P)-dependent dehydrogenase (short-subunit alcohol dehydrogenase family)
MEIEGRVALVTGANRGLGAAIATALIAHGAKRVYAGMRHPPDGLAERSARIIPLELDITNAAHVARAAAVCPDTDILVNNAGIALMQPLIAASDQHVAEQEMRVNYFGLLAMCRAFAPLLARNGGGAIVNVLSIAARIPLWPGGSYCASKAAALSLTQSIRGELSGQRTFVIGVFPGYVDTDMTHGVDAEKVAPSVVATAIVAALRERTEDAYPGPVADIAAALLRDPKAVERQFASLSAFPYRLGAPTGGLVSSDSGVARN